MPIPPFPEILVQETAKCLPIHIGSLHLYGHHRPSTSVNIDPNLSLIPMSYCLVSCPMKFYVFSPILSISNQLLWDTSAPIFPTYLRSPVNCTRFHLWQSNMNHTYRLPNIHICMHAFRRNMCAADTLQIVMIARSNCRSR